MRDPRSIFDMLKSPVGSWLDKLRLWSFTRQVKRQSEDVLFKQPEQSTYDYLHSKSFSAEFITQFLQPFLRVFFLTLA